MIIVLMYNIKKIKYRIVRYEFPTAKDVYFAQYKLVFWMYIGFHNEGHITHYSNKTYCESYDEARNRVETHRNNMKRAEEWFYTTRIIEKFRTYS
jgi:S-adenosylmethionine:diacylglycerol 3-amino-3-carboxypropyl transferase